ncbi:MAG: hypothetical protein Q4D11_05360 [Rhodospirillales bacterium]|nr:hypothetical protein [Rhodospirillales bacterium]
MNRKNEEAAKKAKELKKLLKNASNEELVTLINEVCEELTVSQLRKPAVKYRAEAQEVRHRNQQLTNHHQRQQL